MRKQWALIAILCLLLSGQALAGPLDDVQRSLRDGDFARARALISACEDVNERDGDGHTLLHVVIELSRKHDCPQSEELVALLLERGADCNLPDRWGNTPLLLAALKRNMDLVKSLTQHGADVTNKANPMALAALFGYGDQSINLDIVRYLLDWGVPVDAKDGIGRTALMTAVQAQDFPALRLLLDAGADVNAADNQGNTALHYAVMVPIQFAEQLIQAGANVNARTKEGYSPLDRVNVQYGGAKDNPLRQLLIANGARRGMSPLAFPALVVLAILLLNWLALAWGVAPFTRLLAAAGLVTVVAVTVTGTASRLAGRDLGALLVLPSVGVLSVAAGGALAVRLLKAGWPETFLAAFPLAATFAVYRLFQTYRHQNPFYASYYRDMVIWGPAYLAAAAAGMFLLPLFDPELRRKGPSPDVKRLSLSALGYVALLMIVEVASQIGPGRHVFMFGLGTFVAGGISALILVGLGAIVTLARSYHRGAWFGGLGIAVWFFTLIAWIATGMRWFP